MSFVDYLLWFMWVWIAVACIWAYVLILSDVFRDHSLSGWGKAGWVILLVVLPFLGALIYLIARGRSMAARRERDAIDMQQAEESYIRSVVGSTSPSTEIERAQALLASGTISPAEFDTLKARALA